MNGNDEEWYVMFHGTNFNGYEGIMVKDGRKFKLGDRQQYKNKSCLLTNKVIGNGVYFSNHIEVCEQYSVNSTQPTQIMDKKFIVAFQSRVRPEALRQCKKTADAVLRNKIAEHKKDNPSYNKSLDNMDLWNNEYFVVNHTCDIRPNRILLKQVEEIQNRYRYNKCGIY